MTDEKFVFVSDCADKKRTARGIHNKRTHAGKSGKVIFPSDNPDICAERCLAWEAFLNQENAPMVEAVETLPETPVDPPEEAKALTTPPVQNRGGAPASGSLCFENTTTTDALNLVFSVLGSVSMAKLSISWEA